MSEKIKTVFIVDITYATTVQLSFFENELKNFLGRDRSDFNIIKEVERNTQSYRLTWGVRIQITEYNSISVLYISTPNWGKDENDVISISEFVDLGLNDIQDYLDQKHNIKNFNI